MQAMWQGQGVLSVLTYSAYSSNIVFDPDLNWIEIQPDWDQQYNNIF